MGKFIFTILFCIIPILANATDMCARDNVMVLAFDPILNGSYYVNNSTEWAWGLKFSYGNILGEATCLSATEGLGQKAVGKYYGAGEYSSTFITADSGLSGVDADGADRKYCWCKMTHPAVSHWVFYKEYTKDTCKSTCTSGCAFNIPALQNLRESLFESIGL
ncbi:MAG: hypothetical protein IKW67_00475 [Alphaproteobacteria bacterium]|nr:hypothetical protein [Alphaproteobacteria bacterium]